MDVASIVVGATFLYYFIAFRSLRLKNHRKNTILHHIFLSLLTNFFFIPYSLSLHHTNTHNFCTMTTHEALRTINLYPIPDGTIQNICEHRQINTNDEITNEIRNSAAYRLATADLYKWLAFCPSSISENGISFSISEADRKRFLDLANGIYEELEPEEKYGMSSIIDRSYMW